MAIEKVLVGASCTVCGWGWTGTATKIFNAFAIHVICARCGGELKWD